ncbi:hypothetical protein BH09ACT6_BH09ACT6_15380 [soil metagenome]
MKGSSSSNLTFTQWLLANIYPALLQMRRDRISMDSVAGLEFVDRSTSSIFINELANILSRQPCLRIEPFRLL